MARIQAIRGMNDVLPEQGPIWRYLEDSARGLFDEYGVQEIRLPVVEPTELFKRSIGEVTDIVEKEMYTFDDRNGESLTLRPEGTAGCVRAAEEHGLLYNQIRKLWYSGPMFRYEKPQKGRYRQFHQIGVECFGLKGPDIDAELILLTARLWQRLGLANYISLEINSIGSTESRQAYKQALVAFLNQYKGALDEDSQRRLETNPLRILDSKHVGTQEILSSAPLFDSFLDDASKAHFTDLCAYLDQAGIAYKVNPRLVRGLDYYSKTVFEWITDSLGAQGTVCAGGRYDGLVAQLGGRDTPAVGFAMGVERLVLMLESLNASPERGQYQIDFYITAVGVDASYYAFEVAEKMRNIAAGVKIVTHCGGGGFKSQMKKADKSNANFAVLIGESEMASASVTLKPLRSGAEQETLSLDFFLQKVGDLI